MRGMQPARVRRNVTRNVFEPLLTRDENMSPTLELAESVNGNADMVASLDGLKRLGIDRSSSRSLSLMSPPGTCARGLRAQDRSAVYTR